MTAIISAPTNPIFPAILIALIGTPNASLAQNQPFQAANNQICIQNMADKSLLLTAEAKNGQRKVENIATGQALCVEAGVEAKGTVGAFEDIDALEGCSRLAIAGKTQVLVAYASFDNCEWAE